MATRSQATGSQARTATGEDILAKETAEPIIVEPETVPINNAALAEAAKAKAAQQIAAGQYAEAKKSLDEAQGYDEAIERAAKASAARQRAAELTAESKFDEAKKALAEAEAYEAGPPKSRSQAVLEDLRFRLKKLKPAPKKEEAPKEPEAPLSAVDESLRIVSLYSKIAAGVGLLPGGLLNFAAILAVQVTMVWKTANKFCHTEGKDRIRGSVLSLIGSVIPTGIGHGAGVAIAAIPALITGTVVYFLVTPVLAYAMTAAVGNAFIMHFESGGTLLSFDARAFGEYFLKEFQKAGGIVAPGTEVPFTAVPVQA
jgi:uncharacterized protein (DUF697 family)